jgi:phosphocarrier protein
MLGAPKGTQIEVEAEGPDADEALAAMIALIEAKFGED